MAGRIPLWIDVRHIPVNKRLSHLHAAEEVAAERVLVGKGDPHIQRTGLHPVVVDGHSRLRHLGQPIGRLVLVADAKAQQKAARSEGVVVVDAPDWRVIPLENLIAARQDRPGTLFARARTPDEARLFATLMGVGVHGILLAPQAPGDVFAADQVLRAAYRPEGRATVQELRHVAVGAENAPRAASSIRGRPAAGIETANLPSPASAGTSAAAGPGADTGAMDAISHAEAPGDVRAFLEAATVTRVEDGGSGDRVCLDTTSLFRDGEGLLVGSTARSFVLVHAETQESEFVRARPFRVNAGAVHMYLYAPEARTRYLSELRAGDPVLAIHPDGIHRVLVLGRAKVERRPMTLLHWRLPDGATGMAMLQTAETIRLTQPGGGALAITDVRPGAQILVHREAAARHTGIAIDGDVEER